jgi:hypothetical protein
VHAPPGIETLGVKNCLKIRDVPTRLCGVARERNLSRFEKMGLYNRSITGP